MEELKQLEKLQTVVSAITSHGLLSSSTSNPSSSRFLSTLVLFLVQPCGTVDMNSKLSLASDFLPKISEPFLEEITTLLQQHQEAKPLNVNRSSSSESKKSYVKSSVMENVSPYSLHRHQEVVAMIGLDAMKRANSTLEDFSRSYFMFHGMDINKPQSIFKYLPVLSFAESYIYQMDALNEKIVRESARGSQNTYSSHERTSESRVMFETYPLKPLEDLLKHEGLFTQRIQQEFRSGEEYWLLERKLCHALENKDSICLEDVMRAIHLKSFDYRVLNLLLYELKGEEVNELHMEFLSISEFLVEVADDLFDYENDVAENNFNVLRMFVGIFGPAKAPAELAWKITEAEEKYEELMKGLDPDLSSNYRTRCEEATREGGKISGHTLGTWNIPTVISNEEAYRAALLL